MEFSVLISVYEKDNPIFFQMALESVTVNQSVKPNQVVIVQDGAVPEEIDEVIRETEFRMPSIEFTVIKKEKKEGLASALNTGIPMCRNNWIARMDSDDIAVSSRFQLQTDYILKHPDISVIGGAIAEFKSEIGDIDSERHVKSEYYEIKKMARSRSPMNHVTVMYSKEAVRKVGGYSEDFGKLEDYKLWVDLIAEGMILFNINEVLVHVRVGNGFLKRRSSTREILDWDKLQTYLLKSKIIDKRKAFLNRLCIRTFIYMPGWMKKIAYKFLLRGR